MKNNYNKTLLACFLGYIIQAIVNNFVPLLFLMFHNNYNIPLSKITLLITINFGLQLVVDLISAGFIDKIGYRACAIIAHICAALGFIMLTILPDVLSDPFIGLLISVIIYAIGGGLFRGFSKSDCSILSYKTQRKGNESFTLFLLLGTCWCCFDFHSFL